MSDDDAGNEVGSGSAVRRLGRIVLLAAVTAAVWPAKCTKGAGSPDAGAPATDGLAAAAGLAPAPSGVRVPEGYRDWPAIAPSYRTDKNELRVILGNPIAVAAARAGTLPFPEGSVLAKLAWQATALPEFDGAFVPGAPLRIEFIVKDSRRWPQTGGWGYGRWVDGRPADVAAHATCFPCHEARVRSRDYVFTRWAP